MCLLRLARRAPELDVVVVSKGAVGRSGCTRMVQGGYNAVLDPADSLDLHFADTLNGGGYLNDQELAWTLVEDAPRRHPRARGGVRLPVRPDARQPAPSEGVRRPELRPDRASRRPHRDRDHVAPPRPERCASAPASSRTSAALDLVFDARRRASRASPSLDVALGPLFAVSSRGRRASPRAARRRCTGSRRRRARRRATASPCACAPGSRCATWRCCSSTRPGCLRASRSLTGSRARRRPARRRSASLQRDSASASWSATTRERLERSTRDVVARSSYLEIVGGRGTPAGGVLHRHLATSARDEVERRFAGMVERARG